MSGCEHVVVLHRWRDHYARYGDYVDHAATAVTYVTTPVGRAGVPASAAEVAIVEATDDLAAVRVVVRQLAGRHGPPSAIVALKEDDLLVAAQIADEHGCATRPLEEVLAFRDKLLMADRVAASGVAVPAVAPVDDAPAVAELIGAHGWPMVVKPRRGSSSAGVTVVHDAGSLGAAIEAVGPDGMVQAHVDWPVYHVDGIFLGDHLGPWRISTYIGDCLAFRTGTPLGSVEVDDPEIVEAADDTATRVLRALTAQPTVFHLELFVDAGQETVRTQFLEVGGRVGGAEIPFVWREVHGYDLVGDAFRIALGQPPRPPAENPLSEIAGWLLLPAPARRPCVVTSATSMVGRRPGPYAEWLLRPGEVIPDADAYYEHVGARFRFRGSSTAEVRAAVASTAVAQVTGEPLEAGAGLTGPMAAP
jgi:hypothetical protein